MNVLIVLRKENGVIMSLGTFLEKDEKIIESWVKGLNEFSRKNVSYEIIKSVLL